MQAKHDRYGHVQEAAGQEPTLLREWSGPAHGAHGGFIQDRVSAGANHPQVFDVPGMEEAKLEHGLTFKTGLPGQPRIALGGVDSLPN